MRLLALDFLLARFQTQAFAFGFTQVGVKFVEEVSDVASLGAEAGASTLNDGGIQAEALGNVDASGGSGYADFQLVGGLQCGLVESDGGIQHAGSVRSIDLQ